MAIYQLSVKIIGRNSGRSAVGAAAYRAGDKLTNEYDGLTHDYTNKKGVEYSEIMLPDNAPRDYYDRYTLWNAVENIEKTRDAQLAREIEVALPRELNLEQQKELIKGYIKENFVDEGMCADIAIHNPVTMENGIKFHNNPHAHVLLTMRPMNSDGAWQKKALKEYVCIRSGSNERKFTASEFEIAKKQGWQKQYKFKDGNKTVWLTMKEGRKQGLERVNRTPKTTKFGRKNPVTERWNSIETELIWRKSWEVHTNNALARYGFDARVDCRSFKDQGRINEIPTVHIGPAATAIERRAKKGLLEGKLNVTRSYVAVLNEEIKQHNKLVVELENKIDAIIKQINELSVTATTKIEELKAELTKCIQDKSALYKEGTDKLYELEKLKATIEELTTCIDNITKADEKSLHIINELNKEKLSLGVLSGKRKNELSQRIVNEKNNISNRQEYLKSVLGNFNMVNVRELNYMITQCIEAEEEHRHLMDQAAGCVDYIKRLVGETLKYMFILGDSFSDIYNKEDILQELYKNKIQLTPEDVEFINKEYGIKLSLQDVDKSKNNKEKNVSKGRGR